MMPRNSEGIEKCALVTEFLSMETHSLLIIQGGCQSTRERDVPGEQSRISSRLA
jgi:hypothetical protein